MYKIENSTEFFVKNKNLYIIYAYGNDSNTSEYDIIVIKKKTIFNDILNVVFFFENKRGCFYNQVR